MEIDMLKLAEDNRGLIYKMALRYLPACNRDRAADFDDLIQVGTLGVWKAAQTFDPDRDKSWSGWATWYIRNEIQTLFGIRNGAHPLDMDAVSLDTPLLDDEPDGTTLGDTLADDSLIDAADGLADDEIRTVIRAAVDGLPDRERYAVKGHRLEGKSFDQLAIDGRTKGQVQHADTHGIELLKKCANVRRLGEAWSMLDSVTPFYRSKGVEAFNRDWTSTVEAAVLWRDGRM